MVYHLVPQFTLGVARNRQESYVHANNFPHVNHLFAIFVKEELKWTVARDVALQWQLFKMLHCDVLLLVYVIWKY